MMKSRTCDITRFLINSGQMHVWAIENAGKRLPEALFGLSAGIFTGKDGNAVRGM